MTIGFSTGSLAKGDYKKALNMLRHIPEVKAIELSALRETELGPLMDELDHLKLGQFRYISVHAPSKLTLMSEKELTVSLERLTKKGIHVIVHPDVITDHFLWKSLGKFLCIENMDKRKRIGCTAFDLQQVFDMLPEASFCLDFAHARQVDPTMTECVKMLRQFRTRLVQFHISDVTADSNHVRVNAVAIEAYRKVAELVLTDIPFIIESPVHESYMKKEFQFVASVFHQNHAYHHHHHPFTTSIYYDGQKYDDTHSRK